jgi:hypothetical protein
VRCFHNATPKPGAASPTTREDPVGTFLRDVVDLPWWSRLLRWSAVKSNALEALSVHSASWSTIKDLERQAASAKSELDSTRITTAELLAKVTRYETIETAQEDKWNAIKQQFTRDLDAARSTNAEMTATMQDLTERLARSEKEVNSLNVELARGQVQHDASTEKQQIELEKVRGELSSCMIELDDKAAEIKSMREVVQAKVDETSSLSAKVARYEEKEASGMSELVKLGVEMKAGNETIRRFNEERDAAAAAEEERNRTRWQQHEADVQHRIRKVCAQQAIKYVDTVPFKGTPDNTIELSSDNYVVFDSKSPMSMGKNDNIVQYVKRAAKEGTKYANQEGVCRDIYLVVPADCHDLVVDNGCQFTDHGTHTVTVLHPNAVEPVIRLLKKLHECEMLSDNSPKERKEIYDALGELSYLVKRTIQVDLFYSGAILEAVARFERELPEEARLAVQKYERSMMCNAPSNARKKDISVTALIADSHKQAKLVQSSVTVA